jgi:hypothetical protein
MNTRDFVFYEDRREAQRVLTDHLRLFFAFKKRASDRRKPPKPTTTQKGEERGLVAALYRASSQASPSRCTSNLKKMGTIHEKLNNFRDI